MKAILGALAQFQAAHCILGKDSEGYDRKYKYTSFDKILNDTRKALLDAGLIVVQPIVLVDDKPSVKTVLMHTASGDTIESCYPLELVELKACNTAQKMGAAISYARRYAFLAILGLAAGGEDSDAIDPEAEKRAEEERKRDEAAKDQCVYLAGKIREECGEEELAKAREACKGHPIGEQAQILQARLDELMLGTPDQQGGE